MPWEAPVWRIDWIWKVLFSRIRLPTALFTCSTSSAGTVTREQALLHAEDAKRIPQGRGQGVARIDKTVALETEKMNVTSSGKIDLRDETLELAVRPRAEKGVDVGAGGLAEMVYIGGSLAEPRADGYPGLEALIEAARPAQATLVPDSDSQLTSDHGWTLNESAERDQVRAIVARYQALGARVSLFMDPDLEAIERVPETGADRIELYTESFADAVKAHGADSPEARDSASVFEAAADRARALGLGVNAGHDLDLENLPLFRRIPGILEVSIGHALISDALDMGLDAAVRAYLDALKES